MLKESQVFDLISSCSEWDGYTFDPATYIRAVNILRHETKAEVIAQLRAYIASPESAGMGLKTGVFFLLRLLFEPANADISFPRIPSGKPVDAGEAYQPTFPLYPLALVQDVPLLISAGLIVGGMPGSPEGHIKFCEENCRLRATSLRPPDNPLPLAEQLIDSPQWYRRTDEDTIETDLAIFRAQLLRLVHSVYPIPDVDDPDFFASLTDKATWEKHVDAFQQLNPTWDAEQNTYRKKA